MIKGICPLLAYYFVKPAELFSGGWPGWPRFWLAASLLGGQRGMKNYWADLASKCFWDPWQIGGYEARPRDVFYVWYDRTKKANHFETGKLFLTVTM